MGLFDLDNDKKFDIGDRVRIKYRDQEGRIIDINGDYYTVSVDNGKYVDSVRASELEKCW